jgi:hypothetical protein
MSNMTNDVVKALYQKNGFVRLASTNDRRRSSIQAP